MRRFAWVIVAMVVVGGGAASADPEDGRAAGSVWDEVRGMTLEEKVGQMFTLQVYGKSVNDADPAAVEGNRGLYGVGTIGEVVDKYGPGGIIYFAGSGMPDNVDDPRQVARLSNGIQRAALAQEGNIPMLISTDQEQGLVVRVTEPATMFPGAMALGAARDPALARSAASVGGYELRAMGINWDFAPVADVNVNPSNPVIGIRSFGSRPGLVSRMTAAQVEGYQGAGVSASAKHFPGHGDTGVDSHFGLPLITHTRAQLDRVDLPPFRAAIGAGVDSIMTAHVVVPALDPRPGRPATLSRPILTDLLRHEMGFDGLIVTDALTMEGVRQQFDDSRVPVEAIKAGADVLLVPPDMDAAYNGVLDAVRSGEIPERRIDASVRRILKLKHERGLYDDPFVGADAVDEKVGTPANRAVARTVADKSITLLKNDAGLLPLRPGSGADLLVVGCDGDLVADIAGAVEKRGVRTDTYAAGFDPDAAAIDAAVDLVGERDLVLVATSRAWRWEAQQGLVKALLDTGKPVVVVAMRDPYDIAHFPRAETYLATYGHRTVSTRALSRVLFGEVDPGGKLPVSIPAADDPERVIYPFGQGLGYRR